MRFVIRAILPKEKSSSRHRSKSSVLLAGGEVGPDLSFIGGKFDRPHLIESLLEPSRQIVEGYRTTVILTDSGKTLSGIVKTQNDQQITLLDADGKTQTIVRAEIEESSESLVSIMPEGLAKELSKQEFTDLIAYLESLQPGKKSPGTDVIGPISVPQGFEVRTIATAQRSRCAGSAARRTCADLRTDRIGARC